MKEQKIYSIGIIGLGINGTMHISGFSKLKNCRIKAICDPNPKARQKILKLLKDDSVVSTNDYKKVCAMKELDVICVCTPTFMHIPIAICALNNAKDVFLEKPIAPTIEECDLLIERAFDTDCIVQIGLVYRYSNLYRTMAAMAEQHNFGKVMMAYCKEYRDNFPTQWFFETKKSGGAILDKNCHHFDLFSWFIRSKAEKVYAMGGQHVVKSKRHKLNCSYSPNPDETIKNPDIVDHAFVLIEYENKARANLGLCMYESAPVEGLEIGIMGSNGAHALAKQDATLTAGGGTLGEIHEIPVNYLSDNAGIGHIGSYIQHVEFIECIQNRTLPYANLLLARDSMVISMAAELSIKEKREVFIGEFDNPKIAYLQKKYRKELSRSSPAPLSPPAPKKEKQLSREQLIINTFIDLVRLIIGRPPIGKIVPFGTQIFESAVKKLNANPRYRKLAKGLTTVLVFEYPNTPKIVVSLKDGEIGLTTSKQTTANAIEASPNFVKASAIHSVEASLETRKTKNGKKTKEGRHREIVKIIFTDKGWKNLQLGDSPYKLFLTGQIRAVGDISNLLPYANAFLELGKTLSVEVIAKRITNKIFRIC